MPPRDPNDDDDDEEKEDEEDEDLEPPVVREPDPTNEWPDDHRSPPDPSQVRTIAPLPVGFTPQWHPARAIAALA
jgi:hypothetical protein